METALSVIDILFLFNSWWWIQILKVQLSGTLSFCLLPHGILCILQILIFLLTLLLLYVHTCSLPLWKWECESNRWGLLTNLASECKECLMWRQHGLATERIKLNVKKKFSVEYRISENMLLEGFRMLGETKVRSEICLLDFAKTSKWKVLE